MDLKPDVPPSMARRARRRLPLSLCVGAMVLAAVMLPVMSLALAVAPSFSDVPATNPYHDAIADLASRSIVSGYPDGTFRPDNPVIRQQFAKMIVETLGLPVSLSDVCPFGDVPSNLDPSDPYYPDHYVAVCAAHGITQGTTPSTFSPYESTTRQQLITMVVRAAGLPSPPADYVPPFSPGQFYPGEDYLNARKAAYAGLLAGLQGVGPAYNFQASSTRGECAQLLHNLLVRIGSSTTTTGVSTTTSTSTTLPPASADWPTYHHDAARSGVSSDQLPLGRVRQVWVSAPLDGALYAQPLVAGSHVIVATEANSVYSLDATSGAVVWRVNLGAPVPLSMLQCGNIDPSGITGTPTVDVSAGIIYVTAFLRTGLHHELFALDLATGAVRWHRAIDPPGLSPLVEQERGALTLVGGRIYVPFGGLYGDCGQYRGAVVSAAADGNGALASYVVPTSRMAGIWNPAGPVASPSGDLWVTTGNSASESSFDFGNAVIRLSKELAVLDYFAPSDWASLNAGDLDLGSLGPVLLPNNRVLAVGKTGTAYLLNSSDLGHVGGAITSAQIGSSAFGAAATLGSMVFIPCSGALVGVKVAGDRITVAWRLSGGSGPPIVAAGAVWCLAGDGHLRAIDPGTGAVRFNTQLTAPVSRFFSLAAANGHLFVADGTKIAAFSLR